jgi:hypothetical protein
MRAGGGEKVYKISRKLLAMFANAGKINKIVTDCEMKHVTGD